MAFVFDMVKKNVQREENASKQHFLLLPQYFQKPSLSRLLNLFQNNQF